MKRTVSFVGGFLLGIIGMYFLGSSLLQQAKNTDSINLPALDISDKVSDDSVLTEAFQKYTLIDEILDEGYYDKKDIDKKAMQENAVKGYVDAIGDPYTTYLTSDENQLFDEEMQGSQNFEGIGAVVTKKDDGVLIEEVLKGFPASKAGLRHLDVILEIDGESTQSMSLTDAVSQIRGPKGSEVILTIFRENENTIDEYTVVRDAVDVPSVRGEMMEIGDKQVLYMEIAIIGEDTLTALRDLIFEWRPQVEGVILDLRGNGGGYLPLAVDVASFFLPRNELITTARYTTLPDEVYRSKGFGDLEGKPLVVLIDGLSASAAEIIAGSLGQRADAVLVGSPTFGKGSIQTLSIIEDGSSLKYTIGKRYLPDDSNVDGEGIIPDEEIEFDFEGYLSGNVDNQLEGAKEVMTGLLE